MAAKGLILMVYCPNCQSDHSSELLVCPDCNQELVDKVISNRPVAEAPDDSWVVVGKLTGKKLAERARNSLEMNNVPSVLVPSTFVKPFNTPLNDDRKFELSGFDDDKLLMVPREFQVEAKIIMRNVLKRELL